MLAALNAGHINWPRADMEIDGAEVTADRRLTAVDTDRYLELTDQLPTIEPARTCIDHVSVVTCIRGDRATGHQHRAIVAQLDPAAGHLRRTLAAGDADPGR